MVKTVYVITVEDKVEKLAVGDDDKFVQSGVPGHGSSTRINQVTIGGKTLLVANVASLEDKKVEELILEKLQSEI